MTQDNVEGAPGQPGSDAALEGLSDDQLRRMAQASEPGSATEKLYQKLSVMFLIASVVLLVVLAVYLIFWFPAGQLATQTDVRENTYVAYLTPPIALLLSAGVCGLIGYALIKVAGATTRHVLPRQDYVLLSRLILDEKEKGIGLYILLNSLSGVTGVFTKIGISGLPLATIALTIFLALMSRGGNGPFSQMAQLTLGAFLGSFVERRIASQPTTARTIGGQPLPGELLTGEPPTGRARPSGPTANPSPGGRPSRGRPTQPRAQTQNRGRTRESPVEPPNPDA